MVEQAPITPERDVFTVISWNILLDKGRGERVAPQHERIESLAKSIMDLGLPLDVVMLQEVEGDNGRKIAEMTGNDSGYWFRHSRNNEHIGVFGERVESAESYDLGHNRKAVMTRIGKVAIFGDHFIARPKRYLKRVDQSRALCKVTGQEELAVDMGDKNGPWFEKARRLIARQGFRSVHQELGLPRPKTFPTEQYREIMWTQKQQLLLPDMVAIDDIQIKGDIEVINAGTAEGDSDHVLLWATLAA